METSAYAICAARLGHLYDDKVLLHESFRLYTKGVRELHRALVNHTLLYEDETLGACIALAMYEILQGTRDNYTNHADGASHLINLRGPARHSSGLGHKIFLVYRYMGVSGLDQRIHRELFTF